jgi:lantibiotic biosynthesis protein
MILTQRVPLSVSKMPYPVIKETLSSTHEQAYDHHNFYLLRTPCFPVNYLERLGDLAGVGQQSPNLFTDPLFLEALFLGSHELYTQYLKYLNGRRSADRINSKLLHSIERYFIRMCSRCTPYGMFAGYKAGRLGQETSISLGPRDNYRRHIHLDMHYLTSLAHHLQVLPGIKEHIRYYPNNSLYPVGDKLRYVESSGAGATMSYRISAVDSSEYIDAILTKAEHGACLKQLINTITSEDIDVDQASAFIDLLISNNLLVSELEPAISGGDVFGNMLAALSFLPEDNEVLANMRKVAELMQSREPGTGVYEKIAGFLKSVYSETTVKNLAHTNLELKGGEALLNEAVVRDIQAHASALRPLFLLRGNEHLKTWTQSFREKYEDREIPLIEALDPELGIGYEDYGEGTLTDLPLLANLVLNGKQPAQQINWSRLLKWKNKKLKESLFYKKDFVITDEDIFKIGFHDTELKTSESCFVMGSILADSNSAIDRGNYIFSLDTFFGPSSINLISRFSNGDPFLTRKLKECVEGEEAHHPEKIYAEIIHLPESRAGNLLLRPASRQYEIAYLARPSANYENQIHITDLMVSCRGDKVILRSKKLNKEVVPRLSTAHNYTKTSLPVYKFLCALQLQDINTAIVWDWDIFKDDSYLPRVMYKNILLYPATWNISFNELVIQDGPAMSAEMMTNEELCNVYGRMREQLNIPSKVIIMDKDQKLFIDLEDVSYLRLFHNYFRKNQQLSLQEFLFTPENCFVTGEEGKYANEVIIPLTKKLEEKKPQRTDHGFRQTGAGITRREFTLGTEWLYCKLYAGSVAGEHILKECIAPLALNLKEEGLIEKWFFIRYADPKPHLRIRFFHSADKKFWQKTIDNINSAVAGYSGPGLIEKVQYDTYERELARYGDEKIALSETLFYHDSEAIVHFLGLLEGAESETLRWLMALRNIDMLLSDFRFPLEKKHELLQLLKNRFTREFSVDKPGLSQLDQLYRTESKRIQRFLDERYDDDNEIGPLVSVFRERSERNKSIMEKLSENDGTQSSIDLSYLADSHVHMTLNRMLVSDHRKQEMVLYYLLTKYYESRLGFIKFNNEEIPRIQAIR